MSEDFIYNPPLEPRLNILHRDGDIIVLNKPSGLLTVPGKHEDHRDCLEARVNEAHSGATIVHRLDMDTSGLVIMARNLDAHRFLSRQFETRKTEKTYIADLWGQVTEDQGSVDAPLICDWPNRPKQMVCHERGKRALTHWQVIQRFDTFTRVAFTPVTGRSHQLRVHACVMGHPILGDRFYGEGASLAASERLRLHAYKLTILHPNTGLAQSFSCEPDFWG
ncbi:pseudouridine synthase [Woodsholea maritima]|uniref:pseudouridine synthase n=1 Tax=Woodsholea maritima TaxID=240237 RepID=UPI000382E26C|nr:pseudouridine synthase [Woodsholea maritima]